MDQLTREIVGPSKISLDNVVFAGYINYRSR